MYIRCLNSSKLELLNSVAVKRGYNRALSNEALKSLDPNGVHIVAFMMLHKHASGLKVEPHLRVMVYMKFKDVYNPIEAFLDMSIDDFYQLDIVEVE